MVFDERRRRRTSERGAALAGVGGAEDNIIGVGVEFVGDRWRVVGSAGISGAGGGVDEPSRRRFFD